MDTPTPGPVVDPAQPSLFEVGPPVWASDPLGEAFWSFHLENPWVADTLYRLAVEWREAGHGRCGMKMLWERLRWEVATSADLAALGSRPALNNNHVAMYGRLLVEQHPQLEGMFAFRERKALSAVAA